MSGNSTVEWDAQVEGCFCTLPYLRTPPRRLIPMMLRQTSFNNIPEKNTHLELQNAPNVAYEHCFSLCN